MLHTRQAGVLLHPTSLPSPFGNGDIGPAAEYFIDFLHAAGCSVWQLLPLGPTGFGESPYSALSSFAGNPRLISPERLVEYGLLTPGDLPNPLPATGRVDFPLADRLRQPLLQLAVDRFLSQGGDRNGDFLDFCARHSWLNEWSHYNACKDAFGGSPWYRWPEGLRQHRTPDSGLPAALLKEVRREEVRQYLFYRQWDQLRRYANERGISILGDLPIFAAGDSADVWGNQHLFHLGPDGLPSLQAGVPPDYFSPTGQCWGNPLYRWDEHEKEGFRFWTERLRHQLLLVDAVRIDHFRGFAACWGIPGDADTATVGEWLPSPGDAFFSKAQKVLGTLPLIAEDLGIITPDVENLRDRFNLPGMKILQFAFDSDADNPYLPHNLTANSVLYTGTHDNNTTAGWWDELPPQVRGKVERYLGTRITDPAWQLLRAGCATVSRLVIVPMQDLLKLDAEARMNIPGTPSGNWGWQLHPDWLAPDLQTNLRTLLELYGRSRPRQA